MGKLTNLASGLLGGYVAYKQGEERREDRKQSAEMNKAIVGLMAGNKQPSTTTASQPSNATPVEANPDVNNNASKMFDGPTYGPAVPVSTTVAVPVIDEKKIEAKAMGGMIGEMPYHYDRFSWQRQNFKK